jgi:hypothetical protein
MSISNFVSAISSLPVSAGSGGKAIGSGNFLRGTGRAVVRGQYWIGEEEFTFSLIRPKDKDVYVDKNGSSYLFFMGSDDTVGFFRPSESGKGMTGLVQEDGEGEGDLTALHALYLSEEGEVSVYPPPPSKEAVDPDDEIPF